MGISKIILLESMLLTAIAVFPSCGSDDETESASLTEGQKTEIDTAYDYINQIRANPSAFSEEIGDDLSYIVAKKALNWDDNLAKAAQSKAEEMANNNYFSHTDINGNGINIRIHEAGYEIPESWYADKTLGYFENIAAGTATGVATVKMLILDKNSEQKGHRNSLLGNGEFYEKNVDIGIGYAYNGNSTYKHYWSIIVARHSW